METPATKRDILAPSASGDLKSAFVASLVLHLLAVPVIMTLFPQRSDFPTPDRKPLRIALLPKTPERPSGRIVDLTDRNPNAPSAPDTEFLSDRNRRVERETRAMDAAPGAAAWVPAPDSAPEVPAEFGRESTPRPLDLKLPDSFLREQADRVEPRIAALPPSNYLPHITLGESTLLNTREFRYSSFFIRMKRQIEANWNVSRHSPRLHSLDRKFVTAVTFVLTARGDLDSVRLEQSSGDPWLDEQALAAIRKGAPYLNPPEGLISPDGRIHEIPRVNFIVTPYLFL